MASACFISSPVLTTTLKPSSFPPHNNHCYVLKSAKNVRIHAICCNLNASEQKPPLPEGQKGDDKPKNIVQPDKLHRSNFPPDFLFGAGTSAIQIEGDGTEGGRGRSTGDYLINADKGGKGVNSYEKFKEDVQLLKKMGIPYYRFSISWPRILPDGDPKNVNKEGIAYYKRLIKELEDNGIKPIVTLFHFDMPEALNEQCHGFMGRQIIEYFKGYCDVCFKEFGDKVEHWITINEAATFLLFTDMQFTQKQREADPLSLYKAAHNMLLCHAEAAKLYREKYKGKPIDGKVGMAIVSKWFEPASESPEDQEAADLNFDFLVGWFMRPLKYGEYPERMRNWVHKLPKFSDEEKEDLKKSCDFFGINYYTGAYTTVAKIGQMLIHDGRTELIHSVVEQNDKQGQPIGPWADGVYRINIYPEGLKKILLHLKEHYGNPLMYVTENGCSSYPKITMSIPKAREANKLTEIEKELNDEQRVDCLQRHLHAVLEAEEKGANVKGYVFWSLMDNCEFGNYDVRFGLAYVDY